ncbi:MAG: hydroxylamine reductase [Planctomycetota bacterium]
MFCFQCEQTSGGVGCKKAGVCGKDAETARLQDLLVFAAKGISMYIHRAGVRDEAIDRFVIEALFTTVTNVDFDPARLEAILRKAAKIKAKAKSIYESKGGAPLSGPAAWEPASDRAGLVEQGESIGIETLKAAYGEDAAGVREMALYGLKGAAAYADHARVLGKTDPAIYVLFHELLNELTRDDLQLGDLLGIALKVGELNLKTMELLDAANTGTYGHPVPTSVRVTPVKGKAILVSGHDLLDLKLLLEQTEGKGINIYTHGEMLPCHGYPELKKHKHLVGNYGGAWQDQAKEFDAFPGSILMTTNCIQKPKLTYMKRIFTTGLVAWPGVAHIGDDKDFTPVINAALAEPGFENDAPEKTIMVGFGRNAVMSVAGQVIDAVKAGKIRHFFLVGGCDGAKSGRNYYTELAEKIPQDCVILTLACGKYRFNKLEFGDIGGIPRLLDIGQCNDAYSAIQIAVALAGAFNCGVNELPLSLILSWYEQKAVTILLSLLYLGIKNIRLGPTLPAFITPAVLNVLVEKFGIKPISTPEEDLKAILG